MLANSHPLEHAVVLDQEIVDEGEEAKEEDQHVEPHIEEVFPDPQLGKRSRSQNVTVNETEPHTDLQKLLCNGECE